jgi:hypothetical protein
MTTTMNHRDLFQLIDRCLLRTSELYCGRVLSYGIRQLIKDLFVHPLNNDSIRTAVKLWCENRDDAIDRYGSISLWD